MFYGIHIKIELIFVLLNEHNLTLLASICWLITLVIVYIIFMPIQYIKYIYLSEWFIKVEDKKHLLCK